MGCQFIRIYWLLYITLIEVQLVSCSKSDFQMISFFVQKLGPQKTSYILFACSQVLFPLGFIYANDNKINPVETSLLRGIAAVILNFSLARYYDVTLDYKYDITFTNLFKRNVIVVLHMLAIGTAQFYLPLPVVHTVNFFGPIFIFIIDYFENGVSINKKQFYCLFAGVLGIICTINDELINKFMDGEYEIKTDFKNYISLDPTSFSLYGLALIGVMFVWAYGLLRVRTFYKNTHIHVNFHLGMLFLLMSGFLYPINVSKPSDLWTLFKGFFYSGIPHACAQTFFGTGLTLNRKTGQVVILTGIPVLLGYLISYYRYEEKVQFIELLGSFLILVGLLGVTNCGDESAQLAAQQALNNKAKLSSSKGQTSTQKVYSVLGMA